jgi:cystathionine beta-synthase
MSDKPEMEVLDTVLEAIGNTPLVRLRRVGSSVPCDLLAKVEYLNPGGSVKDRIGIHMLRSMEREGKLKPGGTVVECTSGNTGMGLALASAVLGYRAIFTMPDKISMEKINLLKAMGAEVIVTPTAVSADSPESYYSVASRLVEETPGAVHTNQYHNPENPVAHYESTGPEIWRQTAGRITHFIATIGTGGTITGTGRYLKEKNPDIKVIGVDPEGSILKEYFETGEMGEAHPYKVEGIGEDIIPSALDFGVVDQMVQVSDRECFHMARRVAREEGIIVGGSCGGAVAGALKALEGVGPDAVAVVILPDIGDRYLSKFYNDEWMRDNGFLEPDAMQVGDVLAAKRDMPALVTIEADHPVKEAVRLVRDLDISVVPVVKDGVVVGTINEGSLMRRVFEDPHCLDLRTEEVMEDPLPQLAPEDSVEKAIEVLAKRSRGVLVFEEGKPVGILTPFDVIGFVS